MPYEINVSKHGEHYFATAERSGHVLQDDAIQMAKEFATRFPRSEGFAVKLSYIQTTSRQVHFDAPILITCVSADGTLLTLHVDPGEDFDGQFTAKCADTGELLTVNGWNMTDFQEVTS